MKGLGGGLQNIMKQANQMQLKMKKVQEDFEGKEFSATAGGGAVKVTSLGYKKIKNIEIDNDVFESGDVEILQDMVLSATNEALKQAETAYQKEMEKVSGGMGSMSSLLG